MSASGPYGGLTPTLSALIIGIDQYKHKNINKLRGAVNDAKAIKNYLVQELGVPQGRIIYLENQQATRVGIINAFRQVKRLPGVVGGSPVLIYLAGHGTRVKVDEDTSEQAEASAPRDNDNWVLVDEEEMDAFVPYDCDGLWNGSQHPILDKTISCLIESIHNDIGDNIVVISDCCHSGSITRGTRQVPPYNVRRVDTPSFYRYPMNLDSKLISDILPDGSKVASPTTHVLLAACGAREEAFEDNFDGEWHGDFTMALLTLFKSIPIGRLTPADVLIQLKEGKINKQSPQCIGINCMRYFFRGEASPLMWYRVAYDIEECLQVDGGSLHGISEKATFKVFRERNLSDFVGIAKVSTLGPSKSTLEPMDRWDLLSHSRTIRSRERGFALLHDVGIFVPPRVLVKERISAWPISRALESLSRLNHQIYPDRGRPQESSFSLTEELDGSISIANLDPRLSFPNSPDIFPFRIPADADKLRDVLAHAALFFHHLGNGSSETHKPLHIAVEIVEVGDVDKTSPTGRPRVTRRRDTREVLLQEGRLYVTDKRNSRHTLHGIRIKNNSDQNWFVSIFYFNGADHTITKLYGCISASQYKTDPCIRRKSERTLGFGDGAREMQPITMQVSDEKRHREFGAFKFIFTSAPVNFANISSTTSLRAVCSRGLETYEYPETVHVEWGTLCIPVVITRGKEGPVEYTSLNNPCY